MVIARLQDNLYHFPALPAEQDSLHNASIICCSNPIAEQRRFIKSHKQQTVLSSQLPGH